MRPAAIAPGIYTIEDFLESAECLALIQRAEAEGFDAAPIVTAGGTEVRPDTRNNDRCIFDDSALAERLWERARLGVPEIVGERKAVGLNERFRLYRYMPGQRFAWHADGPYRRENGEISLLTFIVYLNAGYEGGATRFEAIKVNGKAGMALIFRHGLVHEGAEVSHGIKYALRSDVMFGAPGLVGG
jgi:hypothetical protein